QRRDFTINAMMLDPLNAEFLDFHGGRTDLENGVLRHVSEAFAEDPLRVLRGMQFAARYRLKLNRDTATLCQRLLPEAETLSIERIWCEWQKWAHAPHPSFGLDVLDESGWLQLYPQLAVLKGCVQDAKWHPEGDVWTHTKLVVDQAAEIAEQCHPGDETREYLVFAALCHDLGKPATTFTLEPNRIRSTGHSEAGEEPTRAFLAAIGAPKRISQYVIPLIQEHLVHLHGQATPRAVRRLSTRLEPASIALWESLVEADASGRPPLPPARPALPWLEQAQQVAVQNNEPEPFATGRMLLELGMQQGPEMGRLLADAYEAQLDGDINDASGARDWLSRKLGNG
ncbi:MAG: HD domain-containing protein, partial [Mariprofundaceae bacterium]|nr:HD domain-containing protein [Mariprofundaceae bacterium]